MLFHSHTITMTHTKAHLRKNEGLWFASKLSPAQPLELEDISMNSTNYKAGKELMKANHLQAT